MPQKHKRIARMSGIFGLFRGRYGRAVAAALTAALVVAGAGSADSQTLLQRLFGGGGGAGAPPRNTDALTVDPKVLATPGYCPEVRIPLGGETFQLFDANHDGDQKFVRYLASITRTARECIVVTETGISLKVGIAGRLVAGPRGAAGKVTMPLRVTVLKQHGSTVVFDKTYNATVTVNGGDLSAEFSQVIDPVAFKRTILDEDLIVYVGFDQGKRIPTG
jgi:hypothetical protein